MKTAVFPGSFDPFTIGHESVVRRAIPLFDKIIIAVGQNAEKNSFFPLKKRMDWIKKIFHDQKKIAVVTYEGLTVDYCRSIDVKYILRGLRTSADFEFERSIAQMNKSIFKNIETVFFLTLPEHTHINSSIIRDIIRNGGDASQFVPKGIDLSKKK